MESGVYIITNTINNKYYIGSSKDLRKRLRDHKNSLIKNKHENERLQHSVDKYGIESFTFEVLELHDTQFMVSFEQYWMNLLKSADRKFGFNIRPVAQGGKGFSKEQHSQWGTHRTEETKRKLSISHTGKKMSEDLKIKCAIGHYKAVLQLDKNTGEIIREFKSVKEASEYHGAGTRVITKILKKRKYHHTACGYKWEYKPNNALEELR